MSFSKRADQALANPTLRRALHDATNGLYTLRKKNFAALGESGDLYRTRARAIRKRTIGRLDEHLSLFIENARSAGCHMHFAGDAAEARSIVLGIAQARQCRSAVKMKSMLTEEVKLREALTEAGILTVETDLGEWILQLAHEMPSHLIMPALHKQVAEVKRLFDIHLGPDPREDPESLIDRAQRALRKHFIEADLGITGVNFAVAETGTLILVSNEGNGRLTTSGPPVHVALVPIEKIVPTLDEATTLVKMLIRSANGQNLTTYVSWITGPAKIGELDGAREMHIVLVDNGRSDQLGGKLEDALLCIRCGACLNACPVYQRVGGHTYDSVYSGPIGIALTPMVNGPSLKTDELAHASSLCGACEEVCPVKIDIPRLILETRRRAVAERPAPPFERFLFICYAAIVSRAWLYRLALWIGPYLMRPFARNGWIEQGPGLAPWTRSRSLPALSPSSFRQWFSRRGLTRGR